MAQQKMASGEISLQLFPPPPSKATKPKRKPSRRKTAGLMATKTTPAAVTAVVEHSKSPATVKEIVIHVSENSSNQTKMSAPTRSMTPAASPPTVLTERSRATSPAASTATQPPPPPPPLTEKGSLLSRPSLPLSRATSPAWTKQPPEKPFSGANLMRSNSEARLNAPIRSIFPPYNPAVPLAHQNYRPTQGSPTNIPSQYISKEPYSPSLYSNGSPGPTPGNPGSSPGRGCLSAPSAVTTFLAGVLSANPAPRYSTKDDLVDLWEAANGQGTVETGKTFLLKINREESIGSHSRRISPNDMYTFASNMDQPFYDVQTLQPPSDNNDQHQHQPDSKALECNIRRRNPRTGTVVPVMSLDIEPPTRRAPDQDGLVTNLYPKLAAMMALDSARSRAQAEASCDEDDSGGSDENGDASIIEEAAQEAVRRAARYQSCQLFWDRDSGRYYLLHPGLNQGQGKRFVIDADPGVGLGIPGGGTQGSIRLAESRSPLSATSPTADTASTATSGDTLAALEFGGGGSNMLVIDTTATCKINCLYTVDIIVSALVVVGLVEGQNARRRGRLSEYPSGTGPIYAPPPLSNTVTTAAAVAAIAAESRQQGGIGTTHNRLSYPYNTPPPTLAPTAAAAGQATSFVTERSRTQAPTSIVTKPSINKSGYTSTDTPTTTIPTSEPWLVADGDSTPNKKTRRTKAKQSLLARCFGALGRIFGRRSKRSPSSVAEPTM